MARQAQDNAQQTYNASKKLTGASENSANSLYGQLDPFYSKELSNPQGFGAEDLGAMNTANQESVGGSEAGAVGAGNLEAARTRNSAGVTAGEDETARNAMKTASQNAIGIKTKNALLKQSQQQEGASGLHNLYNTQNNDVLASLGLQTQANNSEIQAGQSGWFQNMLGLMNTSANVAKSVSGFQMPGGNG